MTVNDKYPLALPEGTVLAGQYVISDVLGQGGFGITYKAHDHKRDISVAIKEFFPDSMATRSQGQTSVMPFSGDRGDNFEYGKQCFLQEAETLAQFIGNDNIVRIYSYFEEYGTAYFVMDYIEGKSLDDHIKEKGGKLSFEDASEILIPVMDALGAVHQRGIVHRDVAPDNIYLTNDGKVKLLDFGAARQSLGDKSQSLDVVLKHGFAPKEQYTRRGRQGPYTDVYALGATFYFAITGKRPPDSLERLDEDDIVLPSTLGIKIPKQAEEALMTALNVRAEDRYQSMSEFKMAFVGTLNDLSEKAADSSFTGASDNAVQQRFFSEPESKEECSKLSDSQNDISSVHEEAQQTVFSKKTKGKKKAVIIAIAAMVAVVALIGLLVVNANESISISDISDIFDASEIGAYWRTPSYEVFNALGNESSVYKDWAGTKCKAIFNYDYDSYQGLAKGRTSWYWICDERVDKKKISGLCEVEIHISDRTDDDVNEIIKLHNASFGEPEKKNMASGTEYTWKSQETVIQFSNYKERDYIIIYWYDRGVYQKKYS